LPRSPDALARRWGAHRERFTERPRHGSPRVCPSRALSLAVHHGTAHGRPPAADRCPVDHGVDRTAGSAVEHHDDDAGHDRAPTTTTTTTATAPTTATPSTEVPTRRRR